MKGFLLWFVLPIALIIAAFIWQVWAGIAALLIFFAIGLYQNLPNFYAMRANAEYGKGNPERALELLAKSYATGRMFAQHQISYGYLLLRMGRLDEAERMLLEVKNKANIPRNIKMNTEQNLALVAWKRGELQQAIEKMEEIHAQFKTTAVYESLGYFYIAGGELDKALAFNQEALDYDAQDAVILDNMGQTHYLRGEYEEAAKIYEGLLEKQPKFPEPYFNYGQVLLQQGEREKAIDWMQQALQYKGSYLSTVSHDEIKQALIDLGVQPEVKEQATAPEMQVKP